MSPVSRSFLAALAAVAASVMLAPPQAAAQGRMSYAAHTRYEIRHYVAGRGCPAGFSAQYFNYAGWGNRTWCTRCPSGYSFAQSAGAWACVSCPSGTYRSYWRGYQVCVRRW